MTCKNDAVLLRMHVIDCLCKLLGNIYSVKPNFNNATPVRLLKLPINTYIIVLSTQQQVLTTIFRKVPGETLFAISR